MSGRRGFRRGFNAAGQALIKLLREPNSAAFSRTGREKTEGLTAVDVY
jgi:hypothetical protein